MPVITPDTVCVLPTVLIPETVPLLRTLFAKVALFASRRSRKAAGFTVTALAPLRLPVIPFPIWRRPACTHVSPR